MYRPSLLVWTSFLPLAACVSVGEPSANLETAQPSAVVPAEQPVGRTQESVVEAKTSNAVDPDAVEAAYRRAMLGAEPEPETVEPEVEPEVESEVVAESVAVQQIAPEVIAALEGEVESAAQPEEALTSRAYPMKAEDLELWNDPAHHQRFQESYFGESEVTPFLSDAEREVLIKARELVAQDKVGKAIQILNKERSDTSSAVIDYFLANIHFQMGEMEEAAVAYQMAVGRYPKYRLAWKNLGTLQVQNSQFEEARVSFTHVIELGRVDGELYGLLGYCYANLNQPMAAESAYRMAVLLDPNNRDWKIGLTRTLFEQGLYSSAVTLCEALIAEHPDQAELWLMQGEALARSNQPEQAANNFEMVDRLGKATPASLNSLADIYARQGLYDMAANRYLRAMQANPSGSEIRVLRGAQFLLDSGAVDETRGLLAGMKAAGGDELTPATQKAMLAMRARLAVQAGDAEEEAQLLEESLRLDPLDGRALIQLGEYKQRHDDIDNAVFLFERAAKIDGFEADARIAHGQALVREGRYQEALPLLKDGLKRKPNSRMEAYVQSVERLARRG